MKYANAVNLDDVRALAKRRLPRIAFDFIDGGVDGEEGLERNRAAFRKYALLPRYGIDVEKRDQGVTLFGRKYASPFGVSPMGIAGLFQRGADLMIAEAAAKANVPYVMSCTSNASLEDAIQVAPDNLWFQIYTTRNPDFSIDLVHRAADAGVNVLVVTVDVPVNARRERNIRNGFSRPLRMTPAIVMEAMAHPSWVLSYYLNGGMPMMGNFRPFLKGNPTPAEVADLYGTQTPNPCQTWDLIETIRQIWPHKLVIKGVLHPQDAKRAIAIGADGIMVSNHGARQLDRAPAPIEMLEAVQKAVDGKVTIITDSGIRRGADIIMTRCLGAQMSFIGRPALFGAVAGGTKGVYKVMEILRNQIDAILGQIGCPRFEELGPSYLQSC